MILNAIRQEFECKEVDIRAYSPLTLAYIGDAIYDLICYSAAAPPYPKPAAQTFLYFYVHFFKSQTD